MSTGSNSFLRIDRPTAVAHLHPIFSILRNIGTPGSTIELRISTTKYRYCAIAITRRLFAYLRNNHLLRYTTTFYRYCAIDTMYIFCIHAIHFMYALYYLCAYSKYVCALAIAARLTPDYALFLKSYAQTRFGFWQVGGVGMYLAEEK